MKKFFISVVFIGAFASYAFYNYFSTNAANASSTSANSPVTTVTDTSASNPIADAVATVSNIVATATNSVPVSAPASKPVAKPVVVTTPVVKKTGQYTDGTYTGSVADAYYGNVQVRVTVSGGRVTNVVFLQSPNDRGTSVSINRRAMPQLAAEAIQAQSANVNGVSGASDTSMAFQQSLADALSQAKA
jgi:uncharacterized protein with FMN-binding domain